MAIGTGPVSRTRALYSLGEIQIGRRLPDRVGRVLAGLQRVVVEDRLELDEGALVGIGQRLVADELAPGEGRRCPCSARSRPSAQIRLKGRAVLSSLTCPRLTAGKAGLQRAGEAADRGIAGHDLDQRRGGFELAGDLGRLPRSAGTTGRSSRRTRRSRAAAPTRKFVWCRRRACRPARWLRRWRVPASAPRPRPGSASRGRRPRSNWLSRLRQSRSGEISLLMSVLMAKWRARIDSSRRPTEAGAK